MSGLLEHASPLPAAKSLHDVAAHDASAFLPERVRDIVDRRASSPLRRRGWLVRRALLLADLAGLSVAFVVAVALFGTTGDGIDRLGPSGELLLFFATLPIWVVVSKLHGLYDRDEERTDHSTTDELVGVLHVVTLGAWIVFMMTWLTEVAQPNLTKLIVFWALAIGLMVTGRAAARGFCRRQVAYLQNTIIVGAGDVGQLVARKLLQHREYGINLVGFVDRQPKERRDDLDHLTLLGPPEDLTDLVRLFDVERVVVAFSGDSHDETLDLIRSLKDLDVQVDIIPRLFEIVGPNVGIHTVEGIPLVGLPPLRLSRSSQLLKRTLDLSAASIGLAILSPLFFVIAAAIKLGSPGPVFFRQTRRGLRGETFRIYKFRTMAADAEDRKHDVAHLNMHARSGGDARMFKVPDDPRITRIGHLLRRYCLDELPQLINVIRGEMSLVGPRPLILEEDEHVRDWARKRLDIKPGITGLWQVLGRSDIPFDEMTKLDYVYVTNWSLWQDFRLLLSTVPAIFRARQAY